jgi:ubiquinone/menaquinone biosynthesis C-methylase UbiE
MNTLILLLFTSNIFCNGFYTQAVKNPSFKLNMWEELNKSIKDTARNWFIYRAEKAGISWTDLVNKNKENLNELKNIYESIEDATIRYPSYYKLPFHGYDEGNLNWDAALEGDAATLSIAVNYWKNNDPLLSEKWMRYNVSEHINDYYLKHKLNLFQSALDVGCSVGISTEYMLKSFPNLNKLTGIDLSPYFLSMAKYSAATKKLPIKYYHKLAENTNFKDNSFDFIACNFLFHEVPSQSAKLILKELNRILKVNGVLALVDLDQQYLKDTLIVSPFRKWAFEVTEPHIEEYYKTDLGVLMEDNDFINIEKKRNDPVNSVWIGQKQDLKSADLNKPKLKFPKKNVKNDDDNFIIPPFTAELLEI